MSDAATPPAPMIAVSGSTGQLGGRIAKLLAASGTSQRLIVRSAARAPTLDGAEAVEVVGYEDAAGMQAALAGTDTFLLIPGHETADRVAAHQIAIEAAAAAGVRRIVQVSFTGASAEATFTYGRDHWATEEFVRGSGVAWTIARMNFYLDVLPDFVLSTGDIAGPAGTGKVAAVSRDDVAAGVAAILTGGASHDGQTYNLTGREALSFSEIAVTMARHSGKPITYLRETVEEAYASRARYGASQKELDGWVSTYTAVAAGELDAVSGDVLALTGQEPQTLAEWLTAHPLALAHVDSLG